MLQAVSRSWRGELATGMQGLQDRAIRVPIIKKCENFRDSSAKGDDHGVVELGALRGATATTT